MASAASADPSQPGRTCNAVFAPSAASSRWRANRRRFKGGAGRGQGVVTVRRPHDRNLHVAGERALALASAIKELQPPYEQDQYGEFFEDFARAEIQHATPRTTEAELR